MNTIIIALVILGMPLLGIKVPWWLIASLVLVLGAWGFMGYRATAKNPALGFENMVGKTGLAVEPLKRKGTMRIGHELWQATAIEDMSKKLRLPLWDRAGSS